MRKTTTVAATLTAALLLGGVGCDSLGFGSHNDRGGSVSPTGMVGKTVAKGTGVESYTADSDGTVRLYNAKTNKLVYTGELRRKQRFSVDPDNDQAMIDGAKVYDKNLQRNDEYAITFVSSTQSNTGTVNPNPSSIPPAANKVGTITSRRPFTYSAPGDGKVYLYDMKYRRMLTSLNAGSGENFTVDLAKSADRVSLAGRAVSIDVNPSDTYDVYFLPNQ